MALCKQCEGYKPDDNLQRCKVCRDKHNLSSKEYRARKRPPRNPEATASQSSTAVYGGPVGTVTSMHSATGGQTRLVPEEAVHPQHPQTQRAPQQLIEDPRMPQPRREDDALTGLPGNMPPKSRHVPLPWEEQLYFCGDCRKDYGAGSFIRRDRRGTYKYMRFRTCSNCSVRQANRHKKMPTQRQQAPLAEAPELLVSQYGMPLQGYQQFVYQPSQTLSDRSHASAAPAQAAFDPRGPPRTQHSQSSRDFSGRYDMEQEGPLSRPPRDMANVFPNPPAASSSSQRAQSPFKFHQATLDEYGQVEPSSSPSSSRPSSPRLRPTPSQPRRGSSAVLRPVVGFKQSHNWWSFSHEEREAAARDLRDLVKSANPSSLPTTRADNAASVLPLYKPPPRNVDTSRANDSRAQSPIERGRKPLSYGYGDPRSTCGSAQGSQRRPLSAERSTMHEEAPRGQQSRDPSRGRRQRPTYSSVQGSEGYSPGRKRAASQSMSRSSSDSGSPALGSHRHYQFPKMVRAHERNMTLEQVRDDRRRRIASQERRANEQQRRSPSRDRRDR